MLFAGSSHRSSLVRLVPRVANSFSNLATAQKRFAPLDIHPEVQEALATNKPVVALETALVTHGFPYPENIKLAISLENIVRSTGSIPATIGIIGGRVKIGLDENHFERLANKDANPAKISRRDIAPAIAMKADGGTTCSATLIFSALAGIKVFSTGGLGGVHRGGENSMDVSADLNELTRCPVGLVSSGIKSILDIGRTLEYLETLGVPVLTFGTSHEFPAFFSRGSGFDVPWKVSDPTTAARILYTQWQLGMNNGALLAVPIPPEFEEAGLSIQKAVDQAVAESEVNGIYKRGKEATPWLLNRVGELTQGVSRASNIALLENTALVGGQIAVAYQEISSKPHIVDSPRPSVSKCSLPPADLVVIGSAAIDITAQAAQGTQAPLARHSTVPGVVSTSLGGVARNIAEASHRIISSRAAHLSCLLVSPVGDDAFGRLLVEETTRIGMRVDGFIRNILKRTATCSMTLDSHGGLISGVADMDIVSSMEGHTIIPHIREQRPHLVALDGNLSPECIKIIVGYCNQNDIEVFFEPTSKIKSSAILPAVAGSLDTSRVQAPVTYSSPNIMELAQLFASAEASGLTSHPTYWRTIDSFALGSAFRSDLERLAKKSISDEDSAQGTLAFLIDDGIAQMAVKLLPFFQHLVVKCGRQGVFVVIRISGAEAATSPWVINNQHSQRHIIARGISNEMVVLQYFPPHSADVVNVTGAGDSFVGSLLASILQHPDTFRVPEKLNNAMFSAQNAAVLALQSRSAVSPLLSVM